MPLSFKILSLSKYTLLQMLSSNYPDYWLNEECCNGDSIVLQRFQTNFVGETYRNAVVNEPNKRLARIFGSKDRVGAGILARIGIQGSKLRTKYIFNKMHCCLLAVKRNSFAGEI